MKSEGIINEHDLYSVNLAPYMSAFKYSSKKVKNAFVS